MILNLDFTQRLQLVAMLDNVECIGRRNSHAICKLQDRIDLTDDEKSSIQYRKEKTADGREFAVWSTVSINGNKKEFKLNEDDSEKIILALDTYRVVLARDKSWWIPLIEQIPEDK